MSQKYIWAQWLREQCSVPNPTDTPKVSREQLGGLLIEYLNESEHGGFDGFSSRDVTGINRFLDDMFLYFDSGRSCPGQCRQTYYTGSVYYPGTDT